MGQMKKIGVSLIRRYFTPKDYKKIWILITTITSVELLVPLLCTKLIDKAIPEGNAFMAISLISGAVIGIVFEFHMKKRLTTVAGQASTKYQLNSRKRLFNDYFKKPFPKASQVEFARLSTIIIQDLNLLCDLVFNKILNSLSSAIFCFTSFAVLLYADFQITLIMIIIMAFFCFLIIKLKKELKKRTAQTAESRIFLNLKVQELLRIKSVIQINFLTALCINQLKKCEEKYLKHFLRSNIIVPFIQSSIEMATMLAYVALFFLYTHRELSPGTIFLYFSYLGQIWKHFSGVMDIFNHVTSAEVYAKRIQQTYDFAHENRQLCGNEILQEITSISLKDVTFKYESIIFKKLNIEIPTRGLYALIGASGSGKSTLFDLLLGLRCVCSGQIIIGNKEISKIDIPSLHREMGLAQQEKFFFNQSVYHNIVLNRPVSRQEVLKHIEELDLNHYFTDMQEGIDTVVVNYGENLSWNQKAVISLLRASCTGPSVLLLDEIMANIDEDCKKDIERALHYFAQSSIVILITHDWKTLEMAEDYHIIKIG